METATKRVFDFDDTLCRTSEAVKNEFSFAENCKGNEFYPKLIKQGYTLEDFYSLFKKGILNKELLDELLKFKKDSCILTAGIDSIQRQKIRSAGILDVPVHCVDKGYEKTQEIIDIFYPTLMYGEKIDEIIIYEDRPHNLDSEIIEDTLQVKTQIIKVSHSMGGSLLNEYRPKEKSRKMLTTKH